MKVLGSQSNTSFPQFMKMKSAILAQSFVGSFHIAVLNDMTFPLVWLRQSTLQQTCGHNSLGDFHCAHNMPAKYRRSQFAPVPVGSYWDIMKTDSVRDLFVSVWAGS